MVLLGAELQEIEVSRLHATQAREAAGDLYRG
eukprot:CAMPEP_0180808946 /NCGR_PEP_ID=MMETSP1038_2-20121128/64069_1 /TAXON_ID=632150 /ORGANISM="Azadinium spinosum, Strain 3D9" /LENGTH=31 /DNA_ID= /DNA_START= /DNA_END= /DNA_ORIENTATION=